MDPNCQRCGHPYSAHRKNGEHACRRQTLTGWDEKVKTFTSRENCGCPGYLGCVPNPSVAQRGCPHECLEGSRVCVICKQAVPTKAKR